MIAMDKQAGEVAGGNAIDAAVDLIRSIKNGCDEAIEAVYAYEDAGQLDTKRAQRDSRRGAIEDIYAQVGDVLSDADRLREALPALKKALTIKGPASAS